MSEAVSVADPLGTRTPSGSGGSGAKMAEGKISRPAIAELRRWVGHEDRAAVIEDLRDYEQLASDAAWEVTDAFELLPVGTSRGSKNLTFARLANAGRRATFESYWAQDRCRSREGRRAPYWLFATVDLVVDTGPIVFWGLALASSLLSAIFAVYGAWASSMTSAVSIGGSLMAIAVLRNLKKLRER